jgi:AraC-like DNA-binding protein
MAKANASSTPDSTVLGLLAASLVHGVGSFGLDAERIATRAGFFVDQLGDPDARVPLQQYVDLWNAVEEAPGGVDIGPHWAEVARLYMMGALGYLMSHAPTVGEAFLAWGRFGRISGGALAPTIELRQGRLVFHGRVIPELAKNRAYGESSIAIIIGLGHELAGVRPVPLEIRYQFPKPPNPEAAERIFGCAAVYDADKMLIALPESFARMPVVKRDPAAFVALGRYAQQIDERVPDATTLDARIRSTIRHSIDQGEPGATQIARALKLTPRTLQRRLAERGTTLSRLVDQVRRELAEAYLSGNELGIGEAALMLGYSEPSAFHRAFRRWTGQTPAAYRKQSAR